MSDSNITPGTWQMQAIQSGQYGALGGLRVYSEDGPIVSRIFRRADARLISVSPKLLDALEGLKLPHGCYCEVGADRLTVGIVRRELRKWLRTSIEGRNVETAVARLLAGG